MAGIEIGSSQISYKKAHRELDPFFQKNGPQSIHRPAFQVVPLEVLRNAAESQRQRIALSTSVGTGKKMRRRSSSIGARP